jgi:hypothetical protein
VCTRRQNSRGVNGRSPYQPAEFDTADLLECGSKARILRAAARQCREERRERPLHLCLIAYIVCTGTRVSEATLTFTICTYTYIYEYSILCIARERVYTYFCVRVYTGGRVLVRSGRVLVRSSRGDGGLELLASLLE